MRAVAKLRIGRSLWLNRVSGGLGRVRPALRGELGADVAVVGAGITGASVAWRFADAGLRVALVEAARVGRGSTAASTALLMQEPYKDLHELTKQYGRRAARRIWELSEEATADLVRTLRRLRISCELAKRDSVYFTTDAAHARRLRRAFQHLQAADIAS